MDQLPVAGPKPIRITYDKKSSMNPEPEDNGMDEIPKYNEIVPFDPDEFVTAFNWAMNAASGEAHLDEPASARISVIDEDGSQTEFELADTPIVRITLAMKERYSAVNPKKYYSAAFRILALLEVLDSGKLAAWTRTVPGEPEHEEIADSVIEAAAVVRLNRKMGFPVRELIRKAKEIDAGKES